MKRSIYTRSLFLIAFVSLLGCSSGSDSKPGQDAGPGGSDGTGGTAGSMGKDSGADRRGTSGTSGTAGTGGRGGSAGTGGSAGAGGSAGTGGSAGAGGSAGTGGGGNDASTAPYYHLQITFSSTAGWAKLEIKNSDLVMKVGQARIAGSGTRIRANFDMIEINGPAGQATITVDYAVPPIAIQQGLQTVFGSLTKGSSGETTVKIHRIDGTCPRPDSCPAGVEIGSVTGGKGVGKADISFAADQGRNAQPKSAEILPTKKMALAVYYPWYRDRDVFSSNVLDKVLSDRNALRNAVDGYWTKNLAFKDRPLGPDDMNGKGMVSYDPVALRKQVEQAIDAGMDGFLPYYRGITHFTHGASGLLLDAAKEVSDARKVEFRIGHHISPQGAQENVASGQDPVDLLVDWTTDWVGKYGNHPAFMKMKGKPLAIVYSTGLLQPADWAAYRSKLKSKGIELFLVLDNASSNSFEQYIVHFDGAIGRTIDAARGLAIGKQLRYNAVFSTEAPKLWLGEAKPGFDSSDRGAAKDAKYIDRANGAYLNQTFDAAVAINPQWLRIVSWDEYYEHTHVEPSLMYGTTYYDIARTRIAGWKSSP